MRLFKGIAGLIIKPGVVSRWKMRDLLFKNLTSNDHKRRIIASSEISDRQGVHSVIRRHFICIIKEVKDKNIDKPLPYLSVIKEHNSREQRERFFCKIKGSICAINESKLYLIIFMHTLKIDLTSIPQQVI
jgi:hypothetical protein